MTHIHNQTKYQHYNEMNNQAYIQNNMHTNNNEIPKKNYI